MSVTEVERIDVDALIPDGIEPIEEWRTWQLSERGLLSHNSTVWTPGEPLVAACTLAKGYKWQIVRGSGVSRERAVETARANNNPPQLNAIGYGAYSYGPGYFLAEPSVEAPEGYGYVLEAITHKGAPHANCSCGIYSGKNAADCPGGRVLGKVKLWGTIVPGDKGSRAQYGYPSEFHVDPDLIDNPVLKAFGVPMIPTDPQKSLNQMVSGFSSVTYNGRISGKPKDWLRRLMWLSVAFNLSAASFNILSAIGHL